LNLESLKDSYTFSPSGTYYAPADTDVEGYRKYISTLPLTDAPEVFGLHSNANITYQNTSSLRLIDTVLSIQPRLATTGGGLTPDEIVLNKAKEFMDALPPLLDKEESAKELWVLSSQGVIPSLSTVLVEEMTRFNILLIKMRSSLENLEMAINGFSVMTEELDLMYLAIQNNKVPANWTAVAYLCLKPLSSWFKDML
jgi:dynein heavy chain